MLEINIFDWFKNNNFDIILSVPRKRIIIVFAVNKFGKRYTSTGVSILDALINLKQLIEG